MIQLLLLAVLSVTVYTRDTKQRLKVPPLPVKGFILNAKKRASGQELVPASPRTRAEENTVFAQELKRMGATIYEAVHERQGNNTKELTVEKGDILQVLHMSTSWWKLKICFGETGYAPYTVLKKYHFDGSVSGRPQIKDYSSYINGMTPQTSLPHVN